jgi:solute carrier family 27 (fatty acid transporter), member 1/4
MEEYSNKIAVIFLRKFKLKKGDAVAVFMESKAEYVGIWLGLSKIGVISALINSNLKNKPLVNSINTAEPKFVIYSSEMKETIDEIKDSIDSKINLIILNDKKVGTNNSLDNLIKNTPNEVVYPEEKCIPSDTIMYIYTSGTTGLPKPAVIKQSRYCGAGFTFYHAARLNKNDVIYITLPIYHSNGAMIGLGTSLVSGVTVVLRKKFSASNFWKDCIENKCTVFIYVGEICRFLVNQPESHLDRKHSVRIAIGNGLRSNVWKDFDKRFGITCIEFYSSSEGNCTMGKLLQL